MSYVKKLEDAFCKWNEVQHSEYELVAMLMSGSKYDLNRIKQENPNGFIGPIPISRFKTQSDLDVYLNSLPSNDIALVMNVKNKEKCDLPF